MNRHHKMQARSARFSPNMGKRRGVINFWKGVGAQVNDNSQNDYNLHINLAKIAVLALMIGGVISMNSSAIATHIVMNTDSAVLSAAMDVDSNAVGFLLNEMDIGDETSE